jgi:signal transduction histidine kinase
VRRTLYLGLGLTGIAIFFITWFFVSNAFGFASGQDAFDLADIFFVAAGVAIFLVGSAVVISSYTDLRVIEILQWVDGLWNILSYVEYPVDRKKVVDLGNWFARLFRSCDGWVLFLYIPGILISGDSLHRRYVRATSDELGDGFGFGEGKLRSIMEDLRREKSEGAPRAAFEMVRFENNEAWVLGQVRGDVGVGMAVLNPRLAVKEPRMRDLVIRFVNLGLSQLVIHFSVLLNERLKTRERMGESDLVSPIRHLVHEVSGELQGLTNILEPISWSGKPVGEDQYRAIEARIWRAGLVLDQLRDCVVFQDDYLPINPGSVELHSLLQGVIQDTRSAWPDCEFGLRWPEGLTKEIKITGDRHLRSIFRNLLHNAASFAEHMVSVSVEDLQDPCFAIVLVSDDGPGVQAGDAERIFERFVAVSHSERPAGSGVGLALARRIARTLGGDITLVFDDGGERSSKFMVKLPVWVEDTEVQK